MAKEYYGTKINMSDNINVFRYLKDKDIPYWEVNIGNYNKYILLEKQWVKKLVENKFVDKKFITTPLINTVEDEDYYILVKHLWEPTDHCLNPPLVSIIKGRWYAYNGAKPDIPPIYDNPEYYKEVEKKEDFGSAMLKTMTCNTLDTLNDLQSMIYTCIEEEVEVGQSDRLVHEACEKIKEACQELGLTLEDINEHRYEYFDTDEGIVQKSKGNN